MTKIAIVGLGKSGMPVYRACRMADIDTILWDDNTEQRKAAALEGATMLPPTAENLEDCDALCLSPGIPLTYPQPHESVIAAAQVGVTVMGDIELFHRAKPRAKTIAITGTNGKSTTTALIGHILKECGKTVAVGGNIGTAVLDLPDLPDDGWYVLELSSYQIDLLIHFRPTVAVLINLSPDHLDRHGDMEGYAAVKEKLFEGKGSAIVGIDDEFSAQIAERNKKYRDLTTVSIEKEADIHVSTDGILFDGGKKIADLKECPALRGTHNWQNAAIAYAACKSAGVKAKDIAKSFVTFGGLAHRQKIVGTCKNVTYINDSKGTNDQAASMALRTFDNIYWIAGGASKGGGYKDCQPFLPHVAQAFLIGAAAEEMAAWLKQSNKPATISGTLQQAVTDAQKAAEADGKQAIVLLSPACASFDQFKSYEERGDIFTKLAEGIINQRDTAA